MVGQDVADYLLSQAACRERIAVRVAWERVASRRGANFLRPFFGAREAGFDAVDGARSGIEVP
jgi:hypothetical protein